MFGKEGAFAPLLQEMLNSILKGVIEGHLDEEQRKASNRKNTKQLRTSSGTIEGYHGQIRKVTRNKGVFTSDMALLKLIYLATERIARKWTMPLQGGAVAALQLKIKFGNRMKTEL